MIRKAAAFLVLCLAPLMVAAIVTGGPRELTDDDIICDVATRTIKINARHVYRGPIGEVLSRCAARFVMQNNTIQYTYRLPDPNEPHCVQPFNNCIFPEGWTNEQMEKWLDENTTPETRPGPRLTPLRN